MKIYFCVVFCVLWCGVHRDLHLLTPSFPTRRSSDLELTHAVLETMRDLPLWAQAMAPLLGLVIAALSLRFLGNGTGTATSDDYIRVFHRSEEHTSELQSLMRISYAVFCLKKQKLIGE